MHFGLAHLNCLITILRHFGTKHMVPKCLGSEVSLVQSVRAPVKSQTHQLMHKTTRQHAESQNYNSWASHGPVNSPKCLTLKLEWTIAVNVLT